MKCPACGWNNLASPVHCFNCNALLAQSVAQESVQPPDPASVMADVGSRIGATLIDGVTMAVGGGLAAWLIIQLLASERANVLLGLSLSLLLMVLYLPALMDAWSRGSVGKRLTGIRVVTGRGERPGLLRALTRHTFKYGGHFCMPFVLKLLEHLLLRPRMLHDAVARTHVVNASADLDDVRRVVAGHTRGNALGMVLALVTGMLILAVLGLLALVFQHGDGREEQDPRRSAVRSVWVATRPLIAQLQRHHRRHGAFPAGVAEVGFEPPPAWQDLQLDPSSGRIVITVRSAPIAGARIVLMPVLRSVKGETKMEWRCGSPDIPADGLPALCRDEMRSLPQAAPVR